ncbi:hypothetical protein ACFQ21_00550 [Ohtaekwangia kribbensis]|jgi:hypothetical protein|uniref:Uncharacterized protein n=1 Tax=Ohtaekwangia kribbensis TaxID=688913 RepID=A0ABW3JY97_9BACT
MNNPIYFNCFFTDDDAEDAVCTYKIVSFKNAIYPFVLYRLKNIVADQWEKLAGFASANDAVKNLAHELFRGDTLKAIDLGQVFLNTEDIMAKINQGSISISIGAVRHRAFLIPRFDINLDDLVQVRKSMLR